MAASAPPKVTFSCTISRAISRKDTCLCRRSPTCTHGWLCCMGVVGGQVKRSSGSTWGAAHRTWSYLGLRRNRRRGGCSSGWGGCHRCPGWRLLRGASSSPPAVVLPAVETSDERERARGRRRRSRGQLPPPPMPGRGWQRAATESRRIISFLLLGRVGAYLMVRRCVCLCVRHEDAYKCEAEKPTSDCLSLDRRATDEQQHAVSADGGAVDRSIDRPL